MSWVKMTHLKMYKLNKRYTVMSWCVLTDTIHVSLYNTYHDISQVCTKTVFLNLFIYFYLGGLEVNSPFYCNKMVIPTLSI